MPTPFYEKYRQLCSELGKSDNAVAFEIGLSNSTVTTWKQGAIPRRPTIKKVADYFGISVEEMMGYSGTEKAPTSESERIADLSPAFFRLKQGLEPYDLSDADADFLVEVYKAHIKKNQ